MSKYHTQKSTIILDDPNQGVTFSASKDFRARLKLKLTSFKWQATIVALVICDALLVCLRHESHHMMPGLCISVRCAPSNAVSAHRLEPTSSLLACIAGRTTRLTRLRLPKSGCELRPS
jgi:hypothetical protein